MGDGDGGSKVFWNVGTLQRYTATQPRTPQLESSPPWKPHISFPTNWLTPRSRVLDKTTVAQQVKKLSAFYGTRRFITVLTTARQWSLSWARCIHCTPSHPIFLRSIPILSSHLRLGLPSGLSLQVFQPKYWISQFSHVCYMLRQSHPPWFDHPNNIWWSVQVMKLLLPLPFGPDILKELIQTRNRTEVQQKYQMTPQTSSWVKSHGGPNTRRMRWGRTNPHWPLGTQAAPKLTSFKKFCKLK
jgi:hypothetical protein